MKSICQMVIIDWLACLTYRFQTRPTAQMWALPAFFFCFAVIVFAIIINTCMISVALPAVVTAILHFDMNTLTAFLANDSLWLHLVFYSIGYTIDAKLAFLVVTWNEFRLSHPLGFVTYTAIRVQIVFGRQPTQDKKRFTVKSLLLIMLVNSVLSWPMLTGGCVVSGHGLTWLWVAPDHRLCVLIGGGRSLNSWNFSGQVTEFLGVLSWDPLSFH